MNNPAWTRRLVPAAGLLDVFSRPQPDDPDPLATRARVAASSASISVLRHVATYSYEEPASRVRQRLVVVPTRIHGDQVRVEHRFGVRVDGEAHPDLLSRSSDPFGNTVLTVEATAVEKSIEFSTVAVLSRVLDGTSPEWPAAQPNGPTELTTSSAAIADLAATCPLYGGAGERAFALMVELRRRMRYQAGVTRVATTAAQALDGGAGVCQDLSHVLIAACREAGIPARYVSGHLVGEGASHAWVEVLDTGSGEVTALDPTHERVCDLRYATIAVGRDYRDVAPTMGTVWTANGSRGSLAIEKQFRVVALDDSDDSELKDAA